MDFVNAIPDLIERLVQCARLVQDAANINKAIGYDVDHGRHVAHQLILMADIMKRSRYLPGTAAEVAKALQKAEEATSEVNGKLMELCEKAGLHNDKQPQLTDDEQLSDNAAPTSSQKTLSEKLDLESKEELNEISHTPHRWCCFPVKRLKLKWAKIWSRKKTSANKSGFNNGGQGAVAGAINRIHFIALIERDLKAALGRMDRAHDDLFRLMFIAPIHLRIVGDEDAQDFIRNAQIRKEDPRPIERIDIPHACLRLVDDRLKAASFLQERPHTLYTITDGPYAGCLVDRRDVRHLRIHQKNDQALRDTDFLARVLRRDPTSKDGCTDEKIAVLRCRGVSFPHKLGDLHDLVFQLPHGYGPPRTLRMMLLDEKCGNHVKDARVKLALQLCTALHVLHSLKIVHKGVRPESILLLPPPSTSDDTRVTSPALSLGKPYLAGFGYSRAETSESGMDKPFKAIFGEIIYHHPRHLRDNRGYEFDRADDIYSLGICLLEIGLWRSLLRWGVSEKWYIISDDWDLMAPKFFDENNMNKEDAWDMRRSEFLKLAREVLPVAMSTTYAQVVLSCLSFREKENDRMGLEANVPLDFVEEVISKLISMNY